MAIMQIPQTVDGSGREATHSHPAEVHTHDHYHVSLVHQGSANDGWSHETTWHTHEHNHSATAHGHDFARAEEDLKHDKRAHIHDHKSPASSPG